MGWHTLVVVGCALPVLLAGCIGGATPLGGLNEPMAGAAFRDGGSNETSWRLELSGRFHLPGGTRFEVAAENTTCMTRALVDVKANTTLPCTDGRTETLRHDIHLQDHNGDGRIGEGDRIEIRRAPADDERPLDGPYLLTLSLHRELPLFALRQGFADGPEDRLQVEMLA